MEPVTRSLYADIEPFARGLFDVGDGHRIYWEQCGDPAGVPVVFVHGGPGAGASPLHRRFFDPAHFHAVIFDQRGAGRSEPPASVVANTTAHLVADMERLRAHLGVERWLVFGGSWGATLALAYGIAHPERCLGFVLRGVFLGRASEVEWFLDGIGRVYPEAHRAFREFLPEPERGDVLAAYHARLMNPDPAVHLPAARAWFGYEMGCSTLRHDPPCAPNAGDGAPPAALNMARISAHYFVNDMFLGKTPLLESVGRVAGIPAVIVQGRYDMICPPAAAYELARRWPLAKLVMVPDAGHSVMEPGIRSALVAAMERYKERNALY